MSILKNIVINYFIFTRLFPKIKNLKNSKNFKKINHMKKLLLLTFAFTLFDCSGGDDDNSNDDNSNNQVSINEDLVGAWIGTITDTGGDTADQTLTFNSNGTCSVYNLWSSYGETYSASGTWSSTSSTLTVNLDDGETDTADYELSNNNNTCVITRSDGVIIIYTRM